MKLHKDSIEAIRQIPVSEIVGRHVELKKKGREHLGLCPFHNEKTPSFTVNDEKGFYHCFGCGAHGDGIKFVMEYEHLSFGQAVEQMAQDFGITLKEAPKRNRHPGKSQDTEAEFDTDLAVSVTGKALAAYQYVAAEFGSPAISRLYPDASEASQVICEFGIGQIPEKPILSALARKDNNLARGLEMVGLLKEGVDTLTEPAIVLPAFRNQRSNPTLLGFHVLSGRSDPLWIPGAQKQPAPLLHLGSDDSAAPLWLTDRLDINFTHARHNSPFNVAWLSSRTIDNTHALRRLMRISDTLCVISDLERLRHIHGHGLIEGLRRALRDGDLVYVCALDAQSRLSGAPSLEMLGSHLDKMPSYTDFVLGRIQEMAQQSDNPRQAMRQLSQHWYDYVPDGYLVAIVQDQVEATCRNLSESRPPQNPGQSRELPLMSQDEFDTLLRPQSHSGAVSSTDYALAVAARYANAVGSLPGLKSHKYDKRNHSRHRPG